MVQVNEGHAVQWEVERDSAVLAHSDHCQIHIVVFLLLVADEVRNQNWKTGEVAED